MSGNTTAIFRKHLDNLPAGKWLCVEPPSTDVVHALAKLGECQYLSNDIRVQAPSAISSLDATEQFDYALMFLPKGKALRDMYWAYISATLKPAGTVWLIGENKLGVKSAAKALTDAFDDSHKVDAAKHCQLHQATVNENKPFDINDFYQSWPANVAGLSVNLCSQPGVFGHGKVDEGSELLLSALPEICGKVIDMGCGGGLISAWLLLRSPELELTACDISPFAVSATEKTLAANDVSAKVITSDVFANISGRYDAIISNPPFHDGIDTSYNAVHRLVAEAPYHLYNGGQLIIVANRHLKYGDWLEEHFDSFNILAENNRFKVYQAINEV